VCGRYRVRWLIVFPASNDAQTLAQESPFFAHLLDGDHPPWVRPAFQAADCRIYRLDLDE
jgi:hypothetical protein